MKYLGKCLLIEREDKKILVVGDIHIGYGKEGELSGALVNKKLFEETLFELEKIFFKIKKVDILVLLGDIKHSFSEPNQESRYDLINLFDYLEKKAKKIVIIKGNHDTFISSILGNRKIQILDYYILNDICFIHGDRDFEEIHQPKIKTWVMGHLHPAVKLKEDNKIEKYKCFLAGTYKGNNIIILPSFIDITEGVDVREMFGNLAWDFDLKNFEVFIVSDDLNVLSFGKLKELK